MLGVLGLADWSISKAQVPGRVYSAPAAGPAAAPGSTGAQGPTGGNQGPAGGNQPAASRNGDPALPPAGRPPAGRMPDTSGTQGTPTGAGARPAGSPAIGPSGFAPGGRVASQPGGQPTPGDVLSSAITAIESQPSISARIRQKIHLLDHELIGKGSYEQVGRQEQRRFRLELIVPVGEGMSSFQRIHTGKYLWVCEELGSQTTLVQIDVDHIRRVLAQRRGSHAGVGAGGGIAMPLEGLPKLLANLNDAFQFTSLRQGYLDQLGVWQLEGTWKPAVLAEWAGDQKAKVLAGEPINWKALPQQLPQRVVLTLGHDDLFPYRMEYLRELPAAGNPDERSAASTIATLEFFEVRLGGPIPPQRFVYKPGDRTFVNGTEAYLKQLGITDAPPPPGLHSKGPAGVQR